MRNSKINTGKSLLLKVFILLFLDAAYGFVGSPVLKALTVKNCGTSLMSPNQLDRIVGGKDAKPGQYPWLVSVRERDDFGFDHICGGAILNENWIVTAAHCIDYDSPRRYEILVGLHKLSKQTDSTVRKYKISRIVIHENYDDDTLRNDIALLQTTKPIDISGSNGFINGICFPKTNNDPTGWATVAGWGHTKEDGRNSDTLKHVLVPIIERKLCNEAYDDDLKDGDDEVTDKMICAGMKGKDSCQNDSGGPLFQTDKNGVSTIIGIVSHGNGCGMKYFPGVYTKIAMYRTWMNKIMS